MKTGVNHVMEGDEDEAPTMIEYEDIHILIDFLMKYRVIHQSSFDLKQILSKEKTIGQTIEIFRKLSNKDEFIKYMKQSYS